MLKEVDRAKERAYEVYVLLTLVALLVAVPEC